jgi:nucleoside-diphosphate-sugar epimerase
MKVLLTGAFGNIGFQTLKELLLRGHHVRCFDLKNKANEKAARRLRKDVELHWGDLRCREDVAKAVQDVHAVVHLAFVIPKLSRAGVGSEEAPQRAWKVNVAGTRNLLDALQRQSPSTKLLFTSSLHIYGKTQDQDPPRTLADPPKPVEHYAHHKVECERMIQDSGLEWAIFRLGASLPVRLILDPGMFDVPLNNRIEFVHSEDVALAIGNALEDDRVWGKIWLIGGGSRCQLTQRELVKSVLETVGVGMLPEKAFSNDPYPTDWLETSKSQRLLKFQRHSLQDYLRDLIAKLGYRRHLVRLFRPIIRAWLLHRSPFMGKS